MERKFLASLLGWAFSPISDNQLKWGTFEMSECQGRGRNPSYPKPPAQIRTCGITAYDSPPDQTPISSFRIRMTYWWTWSHVSINLPISFPDKSPFSLC